MAALFITSTGTDTGKTLVACAMLYQAHRSGLDAYAIKPVASGMGALNSVSDAARLLRAMGKPHHPTAVREICPWQYEAPSSPHLAARQSGHTLVWSDVITFCNASIHAHQLTLIEGAGGLMSPIDDTHTNIDIALALKLPVVLVVSNYLGAISHNLTAIETLNKYGLPIAGIIISNHELAAVDEEETRRLLGLKLAHACPILWVDRLSEDIENYKQVPNMETLWKHLLNL